MNTLTRTVHIQTLTEHNEDNGVPFKGEIELILQGKWNILHILKRRIYIHY